MTECRLLLEVPAEPREARKLAGFASYWKNLPPDTNGDCLSPSTGRTSILAGTRCARTSGLRLISRTGEARGGPAALAEARGRASAKSPWTRLPRCRNMRCDAGLRAYDAPAQDRRRRASATREYGGVARGSPAVAAMLMPSPSLHRGGRDRDFPPPIKSEGANANPSSGAGSGSDPHLARGRGDFAKPVMLYSIGKDSSGHAASGHEGVLSGQAAISLPACRHDLEIPRDDRLSRRDGGRARHRPDRPHQPGRRRAGHQPVRLTAPASTPTS